MSGRLCGEEWLEYLIDNFLRNSIAIVSNGNGYELAGFFCAYQDCWLKTFSKLRFLFGNGVECIVVQIKQYPSNILWYNIYFSYRIIKVCFNGGIERTVCGISWIFCSQP